MIEGEAVIREQVLQEAARWLAESEDGGMTPAQTARLTQWLAADPCHAQAFARAQQIWHALDSTVLPPPAASRRPQHARYAIGAAMAAGIAAIVVLGDLPLRWRADAMTGTGEVRSIRLPDGSVAMLDTASALSFTADGRHVRLLRGAAAFTVAPDRAHPFVVRSGRGSTTALGTQFLVRQEDEDATRIAVTEHRVRVTIDAESRVLKRGDVLAYDARHIMRIDRLSAAEAEAWTRGRIRVVDRPLGDVIAELNRYHHGHLGVIGTALAQRPVSGTFDIRDPVRAVDLIQRTLGIRSIRLTSRLIFLRA